jgi:hypothetical protein
LEKLEGEKCEHSPESLAGIWGISVSEAVAKAQSLVKIGFFQLRGTRSEPSFWIPFLYRDALKLVQGKSGVFANENDDEA